MAKDISDIYNVCDKIKASSEKFTGYNMYKGYNTDIAKVFTTYQTFLYFCRNLNMFIKKKLKYFTRPKQISPDFSGDFRIV